MISNLAVYFSCPGKGFDKFFNPIFSYSIFHSVVFYCVPMIQSIYGYGRFDSVYLTLKSDSLFYAITISFVYHMIIVFFLAILKPAFNISDLSFSRIYFDRKSKYGFCFLFFLSMVGVLGCVSIIYQNIGNYAAFMYDRINILSGNGGYLMLLKLLFPVAIYLYLLNMKFNNKFVKFSLVCIVLIIFGVNLFLGSRTSAVFIFIYFFIVSFLVSDRAKKVKLLYLGTAGLIMLFGFMTLLGAVRDAVKTDGLALSTNSFESFSRHNSEPKIVETLRVNYGQGELLAFLIDKTDLNNYALGATFAAGFLSFIPRSLWVEKPTGGGPLLTNTISPGAYTLGGNEGNTSYTTGFIVEAYLNLGLLGVVLISIVHFFMLLWLCYYSRKVSNPLSLMVYMFSYISIVIGFTTGEFLGVFMTFIVTVMPIYLFNKIRWFKFLS
ncbi:O-antigen polymerase [Shewanella baltica]|uniref:O-antigen polymerase n=1 Tax=Shewanella baltica TaxID=62322 RepID=UPI003D7B7AA5